MLSDARQWNRSLVAALCRKMIKLTKVGFEMRLGHSQPRLEAIMKSIVAVAMAGMLAFSVAGCTPREKSGTAVGAVAGGTVGLLTGKSLGATAIGATAGGVAGYLITKNTYRCWKTNIFGHRYRGWCAK
jgi:hypothetical protein